MTGYRTKTSGMQGKVTCPYTTLATGGYKCCMYCEAIVCTSLLSSGNLWAREQQDFMQQHTFILAATTVLLGIWNWKGNFCDWQQERQFSKHDGADCWEGSGVVCVERSWVAEKVSPAAVVLKTCFRDGLDFQKPSVKWVLSLFNLTVYVMENYCPHVLFCPVVILNTPREMLIHAVNV